MKIIACIKQVPDSARTLASESGTCLMQATIFKAKSSFVGLVILFSLNE